MSMYRPYSDTAFNNCYDFIMKSKAEKEVWELSTSLTFDDKEEMRWELDRISDLTTDIMNAEYDLCEMEIEAAHDAEVYDSIMNRNTFRKGRNRKARHNGKRNTEKAKRLHKADRYHGKKLMVIKYKEDHEIKEGLSWTYRDCHCPVGDDIKYSTNAVKAREQEYVFSFTEKEELMDKVDFLDEAISFGEREIENLEYEKAFGYLSDRGDIVIEECKRNLSELKDYREDILRVIRTATR